MIKLFAFPIIGLASVFIGALINECSLWSGINNMSVPWICSVLGIIFILMGFHEIIFIKNSQILPHWLLFAGIAIVSFVAVAADTCGYGNKSFRGNPALWFNLLEVLGFVILYALVLIGICVKDKKE